MNLDLVPTVGSGVDIRPSTITGAGNGLFTDRKFERNELITEYCGPIIDHQKALKLRRQNRHSHIRVLNSQFSYIYGLQKPERGQGGASFANDARDSEKNNAVFVSKHDPKSARDRVYLKALCDLAPNTEVFVCYGRDYWKTSKKAPISPPKQPLNQQQQQQAASPQQPTSRQQRRRRCARAARALKRQQQQEQQPQQPEQQQPQRPKRQRSRQQHAVQQDALLLQHQQGGLLQQQHQQQQSQRPRRQQSRQQQQEQQVSQPVLLPAPAQHGTRSTRRQQSQSALAAAHMTTAAAAADSSQSLQESLQLAGGSSWQHSMLPAADSTAAAHAAAVELYMQQQQQVAAGMLHGYGMPLGIEQEQLQIAHMQWAMSASGITPAGPGVFPYAGMQQQVGLPPALLQQLQHQLSDQQQGQQLLLQQTHGMAAAAAACGGAAGGTGGATSLQGSGHLQDVSDSEEAEDTTAMIESQGQQQSDAVQGRRAAGWAAGGQRGTRKRNCSSVYKRQQQPFMHLEPSQDENPYKRLYRRGKHAAAW